jgi:uncharacterized protein YbbC (DUF1343 family)
MQSLQSMLVGLDRFPTLSSLISRLRDAPFGLLAHPASVDRSLTHVSEVLARLGLRPARIFGPEHGYGGEAQDMVGVAGATDPRTRAPIVSLYGDHVEDLSPRPDQLSDLRVLVIDLSDVGSRYYTFVWTALLAVRAAAKQGVHCVLLDRPNPAGGLPETCEGAVQRPGFLSFVGLEPIPVRHGLTVGELVAEMAARDGMPLGSDGALEVVQVQGWDRGDLAHRWDRPFVLPSPNMPTADTALVYPGGCLLEGTNLSEGRGTTLPFEVFGAPWLDGRRMAEQLMTTGLQGFVARPLTFIPTFHKHARSVCGGVQIHVTDARAFKPYSVYLAAITIAHADEAFRFRTERYEFVDDVPAIDLLVGCSEVRRAIEARASVAEVIELVAEPGAEYGEIHAKAVKRVRDA